MRLIRASLLKLVHRPATRITFLVMLAFLVLVYVSLGASANTVGDQAGDSGIRAFLAFPDAYGTLAGFLLTLGGLAGAAYAGAIAGSEWTWGTFRGAVARGESRSVYVLATVAAVAALVFVGWLVLFGAGVLLVVVAGSISGSPAGDPAGSEMLARLPFLVTSGWWAVATQVTIGFAAAFITRSQVAGIVAIVALMFGEQFVAMLAPADLLKLAPLTAGSGLVAQAANAGFTSDAVMPLAMTSLYLVLAVAAASLLARRAEVA